MNQNKLSIGEVAQQLGVSVDTIRRWESQGKISGTRTLGDQRRFPQSEVDRILQITGEKMREASRRGEL